MKTLREKPSGAALSFAVFLWKGRQRAAVIRDLGLNVLVVAVAARTEHGEGAAPGRAAAGDAQAQATSA
jgi:hypothetical protein